MWTLWYLQHLVLSSGWFEFILSSFEQEFQKSTKIQKKPCLLEIIVLEKNIVFYKTTNSYALGCTDTIAYHLYQSKIIILPTFAKCLLKNLIISETSLLLADCYIKNTRDWLQKSSKKHTKLKNSILFIPLLRFLNEHHINKYLDTSLYMYHVSNFWLVWPKDRTRTKVLC